MSLALPLAKDRAEIAKSLSRTGGWRSKVVHRHRNGEVRAQAQLAAVGVGGEIHALADILAGQVEERLGRLQDRGLGMNIAGLRKRLQQGVRPGDGLWRGYVHFDVQIPENGFQKGIAAKALAWPRRGFDRDWASE